MSVAIGIDLGTTNTVVAAVVDGVAVTLEDEQGRRLLPSVVSFHPSGTVLVGDSARERRVVDPANTIFSVKPLLGRTFDSDEVKAAMGRFPFRIIEGAKKSTMVMGRDVAYALPEISAFVLRRAKAIAEAALGQPVDRAVITVPANFNDLQRASTKIAGKLAGLEVMRILNEPTAAALAYGQSIAKAEKIAVYDLGGGTFDVTLLDLTGNVFEVLATAGDTALGGDDIDRTIAEALANEVLKRLNVDPRTEPMAFGRLRFVAEELKKALSQEVEASQELLEIAHGPGGVPLSMTLRLTRADLERIAAPLIERTIAVARQSIEIIGMRPQDFDRVILVGGSTRMPLVAAMVERLFNQPPHLRVNPDEVVALGAAIQAHALNRSKTSHKRKSGHEQLANAQGPSPNKETAPKGTAADLPQFIAFAKAPAVITFSTPPSPGDGQAPAPAPRGRQEPPGIPDLFPPNALPGPTPAGKPAPPTKTKAMPPAPMPSPAAPPKDDLLAELSLESTPAKAEARDLGALVAEGGFFPEFGRESAPLDLALADDAAFARGSAIATSDASPLLIDVTPLSLRVETVGGYSDVLIEANSPVPCEKARTFLTASDNQTTVFIRVAQGESTRFGDNAYLGELELSGLKPASRGEVKILVTFELDADGILNVRARDKETNRETKAAMKLLGTSTDVADLEAMSQRQARHVVA